MILNKLKKLYDKVQGKYMSEVKGSCFGCNYCCTKKLVYPSLSSLEYAIIEENIEDKDDIGRLKKFMIDRELEECPFYRGDKGCAIYEFRPMCCRLFGIFASDWLIPDNCIYRDTIRLVEDGVVLFRTDADLMEFQILKAEYDIETAKDEKGKTEGFIKLAEEYLAQNRQEEADLILEEIKKYWDKEPDYYFYKGLIYRWKDELEKAVQYLEKSLELGGDKKHPYIKEYMGLIYYKLGNYK